MALRATQGVEPWCSAHVHRAVRSSIEPETNSIPLRPGRINCVAVSFLGIHEASLGKTVRVKTVDNVKPSQQAGSPLQT
jgi:hypothetical protein